LFTGLRQHVMVRGVGKRVIFLGDADREYPAKIKDVGFFCTWFFACASKLYKDAQTMGKKNLSA